MCPGVCPKCKLQGQFRSDIVLTDNVLLPGMICPTEKLLSSRRYPGAVICSEV